MDVYAQLKSAGYDVWIDREELLPGQRWDTEIKRALLEARIILIFFSKNSVDRRGYVQRELRLAMDKIEEKLDDDIYVVPIRLDNADVPSSLADIQFVDVGDERFLERLTTAIDFQFQRLQLSEVKRAADTGITVSRTYIKDEYDGVPGYSFSAELLNFSSDVYPRISDANDILRGWIKSSLLRQREEIFGPAGGEPSKPFFTFGTSKATRTNLWEAYCGEPIFNGLIMSIEYRVYWYGAGAAHPNRNTVSYCFFLDPFMTISDIADVFRHSNEALEIIQSHCREILCDPAYEGKLEETWVSEGTKDWSDFSSFVFDKDGIRFHFDPYQVGPYAAGDHDVTVPYHKLKGLMLSLIEDGLDFYFGDTTPFPPFAEGSAGEEAL